jgi:hypothetical protein
LSSSEKKGTGGVETRWLLTFYGTFTTGQWEELREFALIQASDIGARIGYLNRELTTVGLFSTQYDSTTNFPTSFTVTPTTSHGAKLLQAYRALGGFPEQDFLLRTSDDPVFLMPGPPLNTNDPSGTLTQGYSDQFSNGKRYRGGQVFDRDLGYPIEQFKKWQLQAIKHKREHLEYKIKRALDYSDQLQIEITFLTTMIKPGTLTDANGQIASLIALFHRPGAMNVIDNLNDLFGFGIGRPGDTTTPNALDIAQTDDQRLF